MFIPFSEVEPLLEPLLTNCCGEVIVYGSDGGELCRLSNLDEDIPVDPSAYSAGGEEDYLTSGGRKYVVQKKVSDTNGWTYLSVVRLNDIMSELASRQLLFIVLLTLIMIAAVFVILKGIIRKYKPISNLALEYTGAPTDEAPSGIIDEKNLLTSTFAALKDDSEQKQKYENAYYEAEAASRAKSAFLSNMSHDIRTPMNAIVGMTEIASKHLEDPIYVKECLQKVRVASRYLLDIINNVLDMSRIKSGKFTLSEEVIELPKLVYSIISIINQNISAKGQHLIVEAGDIENERILGDNVRLTQVFMNILSNAVKFTPEGGTMKMSLSQSPSGVDGHGHYTFVFTDTGMGMPPEFVEQVFDTFSRASGSAISKIEGTGLGMAIVKNLVELMGGTVVCKSTLGVGTTFTVTLDMKLAPPDKDAEDFDPAVKYAGTKVLILGRNEKLCAHQVTLFEAFDLCAHYALTISDAVDMARREFSGGSAYSYVVINQQDDDRNGTSAVAALSSAFDRKQTKFILAAQDFVGINQSAAVDCGMSAFIHTPLFKSSVLDMLAGTFEAHRSSKALKETVPDLSGRHILVVEDNLMNREIACKIIGETNAEITEASNGKEAFETFEARDLDYFDVILMDLQMPVMNGYEATAAIRQSERPDAGRVPIYALTANTFDEDVRQVREAGMNGHIGKPYTPEELYKLLSNIMK